MIYRTKFILRTGLLIIILFLLGTNVVYGAAPPDQPSSKKLVIDTDIGVDDAAAIVWLFSQDVAPVEILGITTVAGSTSVENATNNVLTVLDTLDRQDVPVIIGASEPLEHSPSSISAILHGPDGLWFVSTQHDLSALPTDAPAFYRDVAQQHPGATLLALGPLTNLAEAILHYPAEMAQFGEIIVLGGSKQATVPFTDFNFWEDPEAADIVLSSGLPVTIITLEAEENFSQTEDDLQKLAAKGHPAAQLIVQPMILFAQVFIGFEGATEINYADVAAAMYAVKPDLTTASEQTLVKVIVDDGLVMGQTFIAETAGDRALMTATEDELNSWAIRLFEDPNFNLQAEMAAVLAREPDNAYVVTGLEGKEMKKLFRKAMTKDN